MSSSEDSDGSYKCEIEPESDADRESTPSVSDGEDVCADDPLADAEWTARYERELEQEEELEQELNERLQGRKIVSEWCTCGNCNVSVLVNISECYCCSELEGCLESTQTDLVLQDIGPNETLRCVTQHPGFHPVCLQKWSLRLAAAKFRTKGKQRYRQKGSEDSFLRSVSYREFTRLVYGFLGNKRTPLPACAYTAIRKQFPEGKEKDERFTGFQLDMEEISDSGDDLDSIEDSLDLDEED